MNSWTAWFRVLNCSRFTIRVTLIIICIVYTPKYDILSMFIVFETLSFPKWLHFNLQEHLTKFRKYFEFQNQFNTFEGDLYLSLGSHLLLFCGQRSCFLICFPFLCWSLKHKNFWVKVPFTTINYVLFIVFVNIYLYIFIFHDLGYWK